MHTTGVAPLGPLITFLFPSASFAFDHMNSAFFVFLPLLLLWFLCAWRRLGGHTFQRKRWGRQVESQGILSPSPPLPLSTKVCFFTQSVFFSLYTIDRPSSLVSCSIQQSLCSFFSPSPPLPSLSCGCCCCCCLRLAKGSLPPPPSTQSLLAPFPQASLSHLLTFLPNTCRYTVARSQPLPPCLELVLFLSVLHRFFVLNTFFFETFLFLVSFSVSCLPAHRTVVEAVLRGNLHLSALVARAPIPLGNTRTI